MSNNCEFPRPSKTDQITNQPTNQGRHTAKHCLCCEYRVSFVSFGPSRGQGYTQINPIPRGGRPITWYARQRHIWRVSKQRTQYPPSQFIPHAINHLERGVTKP